MQLRTYFPTVESVIAAPVFDVAGVVMELLSNNSVIAANTLNTWAEEYRAPAVQDKTVVVRQALSEAWSWLHTNGLIAEDIAPGGGPHKTFITRAGRRVDSRAQFLAYTKASLLPADILHPDMAQVALPLFLGGHFDHAVSAAFIQLEVSVREACEFPADLVGTELMRRAFHPNSGPLTMPDAVAAEREAALHLFSGAMGYYKNPLSLGSLGFREPSWRRR